MMIKVYSQPNCPQCDVLKNWLKGNGYQFSEVNIREDGQALSEIQEMGYMATPVVKVEGKGSVAGFNGNTIKFIKEYAHE